MKENKIIMVKTRRGKIMRVIREHYLRDDIEHGIGTGLEKEPGNSPNSFCSQKHWLLPDTNVFLKNMDVMEDNRIENVIILQTVMVRFLNKAFIFLNFDN